MKNLPISVVIPTMNRPKSLEQTLESVLSQEHIPGEIIIIDQTEKGTDEQKTNLNLAGMDENIIYVHQEEPALTRARNVGLQNCHNDIVVFMDDDVDLLDDIFIKIKTIMDDPSIAMIAGLNDDTYQKKSTFGYLFYLKSFKKRSVGHVTRSIRGRFPDKVEKRIKTEWAMGFFFVIRKSCAMNWNLCWTELFRSYAYAEDLDFSYGYYLKAKENKMQCIIDPTIVVHHNASQEYRIPKKKQIYMDIFHRMYIHYKYDDTALGMVLMQWTNLGLLLESTIKRRKPKVWFAAIRSSIKLRKDIRRGGLHYELYE